MATALGELVKVLLKGKITIPSNIRKKLGINEDDCVTFEMINCKIVILPQTLFPAQQTARWF